MEFLHDNRILYTENVKQLMTKISKFVVLNEEECVLDIYTGKMPVTKSFFKEYVQQTIKNNKKRLILISDKKLTTEAKECLKDNEINVKFIYFKDNASLNKKLERLFYEE